MKPGGDRWQLLPGSARPRAVRTRSNSSVTGHGERADANVQGRGGRDLPAKPGREADGERRGRVRRLRRDASRRCRHDDYARRNVSWQGLAIFLGRTGPKGFTNARNRILNARGRAATERSAPSHRLRRPTPTPAGAAAQPGRPHSAWTFRPRSVSTRRSRRRSPRATISSTSCSAPRARTTRR